MVNNDIRAAMEYRSAETHGTAAQPGTVLLVICRTANPDSAAISARALPLDVRAAFADLLRMPTGAVTSDGIRAALGVTDYRFRKVRRALVDAGYLLHLSTPVDGGWQHLYAVTDMAGTLPPADELKAMADRVRTTPARDEPGQDGTSRVDVREDESGHSGTSKIDGREDESGQDGTADSDAPGSGRGESTSAVTCEDEQFDRAFRDVDSRRRTGSCSPRRGEAEAAGVPARVVEDARAGGGPVEPVVREQAKRQPVSVVGSMAGLEKLAKLPEKERPAGAGPLWVSNRGCLALARGMDQDVVEDGLRLLASLELPFWFAPKTWALIESGWSLERLRTLFTENLDGARSVWAVCEKRLNAAVPDVPGGLPVDDPAPAPAAPVWDQIDDAAEAWPAPAPAPGTAPWDLPRSQWRAKSNPGAPAYEDTRRQMEAVDPGPASSREHIEAAMSQIRAAVSANSTGRAPRRKVVTYSRA
ncbi:hypothetical protein [Streptomyces albogriseolus]|uniref:hypothetical protein n=1 Tax=Streptomyces albogriseolus TaxID=1887 RepID=UPI00345F4988